MRGMQGAQGPPAYIYRYCARTLDCCNRRRGDRSIGHGRRAAQGGHGTGRHVGFAQTIGCRQRRIILDGKTRVKLLKTLASAILPIKKNKLIRRLRSTLNHPAHITRRSLRGLWELQDRERMRLWTEMSQVKGLLQLLMMQRNGYRWSEADRLAIRVQLRKLVSLSPYLVLFVSPGGFLALPALAWWLDRRRQKRLEHGRQTTR